MILLLSDTGVQSFTKCRSWFVVTSAKPYTCPTCEQVYFEYDEEENSECFHAVGLGTRGTMSVAVLRPAAAAGPRMEGGRNLDVWWRMLKERL
jgi:hypothetical protein